MKTTDQEISQSTGRGEPREGSGGPRSPWRIAPWTVMAALAAALIAWAVGETPLVQVPARAVSIDTMGQKSMATTAETELAAINARSVRSQAVFGALLGLTLGAAGGLAGRSRRGFLTASFLGTVLGGVVGGVVSYTSVLFYFRFRESFENDLIPSLLMHALMAAAVGASASLVLGFGVGTGRRLLARVVFSGAFGAVIGAFSFELLGAVLFANDHTGEPLSASSITRLLAHVLIAIAVALGATSAFAEDRNLKPQTGIPTA